MANVHKTLCLEAIEPVLGSARRAAKGNSLYRTEAGTTLYIRYSRRHFKGSHSLGFYGLRTSDIRYLQQEPNAAIVFHTDSPDDLIFIPLPRMLEFLESARPAQDGMYKLQISFSGPPELILAGAGRVGLGAFSGVPLRAPRKSDIESTAVDRMHTVMQMKIKEIGLKQGYNIWIPRADRGAVVHGKKLGEDCLERLEIVFPKATMPVIENIDVLWFNHVRHRLEAMFEVEHSTTIYSGLLRLNDVLIDYDVPSASIVTDVTRLDTFLRHIQRRTFEVSGLSALCSHYTYEDIETWHTKVMPNARA